MTLQISIGAMVSPLGIFIFNMISKKSESLGILK
jgi:hypothetical protein